MVKLDRIYTRGGDKGETSLGDGQRTSKHSRRIVVGGALDEANATIGIARLHASTRADAMLARIQNDLFDAGADLTIPGGGRKREGALRISQAQVERLEAEIDAMNKNLEPLRSFILPGGSPAAAHLHFARAVVRRAETILTRLTSESTDGVSNELVAFVNRLSDHLFVLARTEAAQASGDVLWTPGENR